MFSGLYINLFLTGEKKIFPLLETMPDVEIEMVEAHENSWTHAEKEEQFLLYKEIYLAEIHPCMVEEEELRKMAETISSSADIGLD